MAKIPRAEVGIPKIEADASVLTILDTVYFMAGAIAVLIIVIAGFLYVTSGGSPERVKQAKNALIGAVVGLIVIVLAFAITEFIIGRLA